MAVKRTAGLCPAPGGIELQDEHGTSPCLIQVVSSCERGHFCAKLTRFLPAIGGGTRALARPVLHTSRDELGRAIYLPAFLRPRLAPPTLPRPIDFAKSERRFA